MSSFRLKGSAGQVINRSWSLDGGVAIGSSEACEIRIENESVAPRHAEVTVEGGQVTLRLLASGGGLYLNGEPIEQAPLVSGDEIRIGNNRWLLQAPGLKPERVLTESAVRRRVRLLPWIIAGVLSAAALLAWRLGFLPF